MLLPWGCQFPFSLFSTLFMMHTYWTYIEISVVVKTPNNHQAESHLCHTVFPAVPKPSKVAKLAISNVVFSTMCSIGY